MSASIAKLPADVWYYFITSGEFQTRDINALCLVSKDLFHTCRPVLYRRLRLHDSFQYVQETMQLLKRDVELSNKVKELEVRTSKVGFKLDTAWIDVEIFASLGCLNKLLFKSWPFRTCTEQDRFSTIVSEHCLALTSFACVMEYSSSINTFPSPRLHIPRLKAISWFDTKGFNQTLSPLTDLARASSSTIVSVNFPVTMNMEIGGESPFFTLAFPKLGHLFIGPSLDGNEPMHVILPFFTRHPTLEHLSLCFRTAIPYGLPTSVCPNLRQLTVCLPFLTGLLNVRAGFLETLVYLSAIPGSSSRWKSQFSDFNSALTEYGKLPNVKCLTIDWGTSRPERDTVEECMERYVESFPNIETWHGDLPDDRHIHILSSFSRLKTIRHNWDLKKSLDTAERYIQQLAVKLTRLEIVTLYEREEMTAVFQVDRRREKSDVVVSVRLSGSRDTV